MAACGGGGNDKTPDAGPIGGTHQCNDGIDNDGDGKIDFPDDPGCTNATDDSEDSLAAPQCSDGRDNDGDGKVDYPNDPGCFSPQQDDETDDCPDGPNCPQCADGKDNDGNGKIDYPMDPGCSAASDTMEFTENPLACGASATIKQLPMNGTDTGNFAGASQVNSPTCGGNGPEVIYELHVAQPQVMVATTAGSATDTTLYLRDQTCMTEIGCNDDVSGSDSTSSLTVSLQAGTYYLVVDSSASNTSSYTINVKFYVGEGVGCTTSDMCGPGLVCRIPMGGTAKVCSKHVCSDGVDDDGDGKKDFPDDPGCTSADDDDETDDCPSGPNCPQCADGKDNDMDGKTDYPDDTSCSSASGTSEACMTHEGTAELTMAHTMDDNSTAVNDFHLTCGFEDAPDKTYSLNLPKMATLTIDVDSDDVFPEMELLGATCTGTAVVCSSSISKTNLAAGQYFLVVQSDFSDEIGPYTINVSGTIALGEKCTMPLAVSGAITCGDGNGCGPLGTCVKAECSDGIDNNMDGKIDWPDDPGCASPNDATENNVVCPGASCPVCADGMDNDADTLVDFPADWGCSSAGADSEKFCPKDTDAAAQKLITMPTTMVDTTTLTNDFDLSCGSSFSDSGPDVALGLSLPVPVAALTITSSGFDTVLSLQDASCSAKEYACEDGDAVLDSLTPSRIDVANVKAGNYAVVLDGYFDDEFGNATITVSGTVANGTKCESALFTNGVLKCTGAATCKGTAGSKTCAP